MIGSLLKNLKNLIKTRIVVTFEDFLELIFN